MIDVLVFVLIISVLIFSYSRSVLHEKVEELIAANSRASDIMASQASRVEQLLNEKQQLTDRVNKITLAETAAKIKIDKLNAQLKQERAKSKDKLKQERAKFKEKEAGYKGQIKSLNKEVKKLKASIK